MRARCFGPSEPAYLVRLDCSYILPIRITDADSAGQMEELAAYLTDLVSWCSEVIVVDGSPSMIFARNARSLPHGVRHVAPDARHASLMGKVTGVLTGVDLAAHEALIVADDDVRYTRAGLARVVELLGGHDLVRPQNYFSPLPWHALWDSARTLLNRSLGADFPGTLGVRRSTLRACGGYDGDVMFENLELMRTIEVHGGTTASPLDLYVRRLPPSAEHFVGQRTRQAYDDFAIPARMTLWLLIAPAIGISVSRRSIAAPATVAGVSIALAELGRRRAGGASRFPATVTLLAPAWVGERAVCVWLAVFQRLAFGGIRYGDSIIRTAAHSRRELALRRARATPEPQRFGDRDPMSAPAAGR